MNTLFINYAFNFFNKKMIEKITLKKKEKDKSNNPICYDLIVNFEN